MLITLQGVVPSKKNSYRRGKNGGFYIDRDVQDLLDDLHIQLNTATVRPRSPLTGPLRVVIRLYGDMRRDADNQATSLLDLLQKARYIKNDKDVVKLKVDKEKITGIPYTEIELSTL